jgi:hypothetical protein
VLSAALHSSAAAFNGIVYRNPPDETLGGLPQTPPMDVFLDGGDPEFFIESTSTVPSGGKGGLTLLVAPSLWGLAGDSAGHITNYPGGFLFDHSTMTYAFPQPIFPGSGVLGLHLTGYDFGLPGQPDAPLGQYFNASAPQDYYWAFAFSPDGTIGTVPGWMRVTITPVSVDAANETVNGGQVILREYAYNIFGSPLRIGEIPEPATAALGAFAFAACTAVRRRRS